MSILPTSPSVQPHKGLATERDALTQMTGETTISVDHISIVNLYVSLKSKPMAILTGAAHSGKSEMVRSLAQSLTDGDLFRCQMMNGHAWWAENSGNAPFFVQAQTRLNTAKLLALIEEAWQPENVNRVYVACITHMSPAELIGFFTEVAFQLQHGEIMRLPGAHLTEPIPYPPNLLLIGTIDTTRFDWSDDALLSTTTIIQWPMSETERTIAPEQEYMALGETQFLYSLIRDVATARLKLGRILGSDQCALQPLHVVERLLHEYRILLPDSVRNEILIYLANAWSIGGVGLFDSASRNNLTIALDLAITQILLPRVCAMIQDVPALRKKLREKMINRFSRTAAFLECLN